MEHYIDARLASAVLRRNRGQALLPGLARPDLRWRLPRQPGTADHVLNGGAERISRYGAKEILGHSCSEGILRQVNDAGGQLRLNGCPLAEVMKDGKPSEARSRGCTVVGHQRGQPLDHYMDGGWARDPPHAGRLPSSGSFASLQADSGS